MIEFCCCHCLWEVTCTGYVWTRLMPCIVSGTRCVEWFTVFHSCAPYINAMNAEYVVRMLAGLCVEK